MIDPQDMSHWLEQAGATMMCLRQPSPVPRLAQSTWRTIDEESDFPESAPLKKPLPVPDAREIQAMDIVLSWLPLLGNKLKQRLVALRSQYHPTRGKVVCRWAECARKTNIPETSARRWHKEAVLELCRRVSNEVAPGDIARVSALWGKLPDPRQLAA